MNIRLIVAASVLVSVVAVFLWNSKQGTQDPKSDEPLQSEQVEQSTQISYEKILNNAEFKQRMLAAVENHQDTEIDILQRKAIEIGRAAGFNDIEMSMLQGERARNYMVFRARRALFYKEFSKRYYLLEDFQDLKKDFPEARDLFPRADILIEQRDVSILDAAKELAAGDNEDYMLYLDRAKQQWLSLVKREPLGELE